MPGLDLSLNKEKVVLNAKLGQKLIFDNKIAAQQRMHIQRNFRYFRCASNAILEAKEGPRQPPILAKAQV